MTCEPRITAVSLVMPTLSAQKAVCKLKTHDSGNSPSIQEMINVTTLFAIIETSSDISTCVVETINAHFS